MIVFALALGIGANTAIFTAANDFLFRPLPFPDSGRLVALTEIGKRKARSPAGPLRATTWIGRSRSHVLCGNGCLVSGGI
jgi:hypothetical protein